MAPFGPWADHQPDLLSHIADGLTIDSHACVRAVCTSWRSVLRPASPSLLVLHADAEGKRRASTLCLCPNSSTFLKDKRLASLLFCGCRCVGSSDGWLAIDGDVLFALINSLTGEEMSFPSFTQEVWISKMVFAPNPKPGDFTGVAITGLGGLSYAAAGSRSWRDLECLHLVDGDCFIDVAYHEEVGKKKAVVYCLTRCGDVHLIHLPSRRSRVVHVEPLLSKRGIQFDPAAVFPPPYDTVSKLTGAKYLALCDGGDLYQIWRNTTCAIPSKLPGGGNCRVLQDAIFVLKYNPRRMPCWEAVSDLGGWSVFVGRNNALSLQVKDGMPAPGMRGDCVYWIGGSGRDQGMVFDMQTGTSTQCFPGMPCRSTICWFNLGDTRSKINNNTVSRPYQLRKRTRPLHELD